MMGGYGNDGMGAGQWLVMGLFWLALIGVIIWAVIRLLPVHDGGTGHGDSAAGVESPQEILDRRFARGQIDLETYQVQRAALVSARGKSQSIVDAQTAGPAPQG
jgi:putative membrane protein